MLRWSLPLFCAVMSLFLSESASAEWLLQATYQEGDWGMGGPSNYGNICRSKKPDVWTIDLLGSGGPIQIDSISIALGTRDKSLKFNVGEHNKKHKYNWPFELLTPGITIGSETLSKNRKVLTLSDIQGFSTTGQEVLQFDLGVSNNNAVVRGFASWASNGAIGGNSTQNHWGQLSRSALLTVGYSWLGATPGSASTSRYFFGTKPDRGFAEAQTLLPNNYHSIPAPATLVGLLSLGLVAAIWRQRKRRRTS